MVAADVTSDGLVQDHVRVWAWTGRRDHPTIPKLDGRVQPTVKAAQPVAISISFLPTCAKGGWPGPWLALFRAHIGQKPNYVDYH